MNFIYVNKGMHLYLWLLNYMSDEKHIWAKFIGISYFH